MYSYQVDLYVSRDPDSRLSDREHAAVQDWLNSDSSIHVMRDHPRHDFSMLGCSWGTKLSNETIRSKWKKSWKSGLEDNIMWVGKHEWGEDQQFLDKYVFCGVTLHVILLSKIRYIFLYIGMFGHGHKKNLLDMIRFTAKNIKIQNHSQLNGLLAQIILLDQIFAKI